jgi:exodeoxyribonuclease V gamma subunit
VDLASITTEHPLQPFSRRYFEEGGLLTYAREWGAAHEGAIAEAPRELPPLQLDPGFRLRLSELARFIRQPVRQFFRNRLQVAFDEAAPVTLDDEPFALDDLDEFRLGAMLLEDGAAFSDAAPEQAEAALHQRAARLRRQGLLPLGLIGVEIERYLVAEFAPAYAAWLQLCRRHALPSEKLRISVPHQDVLLEDWLDRLRSDGSARVWLAQNPGRLVSATKEAVLPRPHKLIDAWVRQLAAAADGQEMSGYLVGRDAVVVFDPIEPAEAQIVLSALIGCWKEGMQRPLPAACKTGLELLAGGDPRKVYDGGFNGKPAGEVRSDPCLARLWPDFESFAAEPGWEACCRRLYGPLAEWTQRHVRVLSLQQVLEWKESA